MTLLTIDMSRAFRYIHVYRCMFPLDHTRHLPKVPSHHPTNHVYNGKSVKILNPTLRDVDFVATINVRYLYPSIVQLNTVF